MNYIRIQQNDTLPDLARLAPYKCVVIIEDEVSVERQSQISDWLVSTGCLYMMAWGINCSSWDDSVDESNLVQFDYQDIPDESFVSTTWHEGEPLSEVFEFAKNNAKHESFELKHCVILHLSSISKKSEYEHSYSTV